MSRSTSKKTGKNGNNKGAQNKASNKPVAKPEQKTNVNQATSSTDKPKVDKTEGNQKSSVPNKELDNNKQTATTKQTPSKKEATQKSSNATEKPVADREALSSKDNQEISNHKKPLANKENLVKKEPSIDQNSQSTGTETVQTTTNQPSSRKQGSGLSLFAILLSLMAVGFSGYQWYSSKINSTNTDTQFAIDISQISGNVTRISDSVARLKADQSDIVTQAQLDNKIIKANSDFDKQVRDLEQAQSNITASVTTINEELRKGANQYVLDEVSQLLRLGNNSAIFTNDAESAVNAFTLADTQLKELNNPRYAVVRRKINEEIQLLKSIEQVDSENILAQLSLITSKVSSLPLENKLPEGNSFATADASTNNNENITWRTELNKMWSDVINSVSIQKVDQPPKALLAPRERYLLDQNLKLQLVKAEIALLQNNQTLYKNSITEATKWVSDYFDPEDDLVKKTLSQLASLKNEKLNIQLPGVSGSYDLLQTIKGGQ